MIQFISHSNERCSYLDGIRLALEGGCKWVQLRMKDAPDEQVAQLGVQARELCERYGAKLILDDRVELVAKTGADGVDCHFDPKFITADLIKTIRDAGYEFHVWTVDRLDQSLLAFERGAQTVTTNCAKKLRDAYEANRAK